MILDHFKLRIVLEENQPAPDFIAVDPEASAASLVPDIDAEAQLEPTPTEGVMAFHLDDWNLVPHSCPCIRWCGFRTKQKRGRTRAASASINNRTTIRRPIRRIS